MAASNWLKKYTCFEWKVSFDGGESPTFLLQNHKCRLDLEFGPKKTTDHVLTIKSESKIALSFAVKVQVIAGKSPTTDPTRTVEGIAPFEIWRGDFGEFARMKYDFLLFRVMFTDSSNIELIEDAKAKTVSSSKKVTCLEWITNGDPRKMESSKFLIGDRTFFLNFDERRGCPAFSRYTLALDSDTKERLRFDAECQVGWGFGEVTRGQESFKGKPPFLLWRSDFLDDLRQVVYFRVFFYNCLNIKLIEDADAKKDKNSESSLRCLSADIGKMLGSNASDFKSDVTVQCGDTTFSAHQIILATRSEVLKAMLQENEAESGPSVLQIEGMQPSVCKIFLDYLYTATLPDLSVELAKALHMAATKYGVDSLEKQCSNLPRENFNDDEISQSSLRSLSSDLGKMLGSNASDFNSDVTVQCGDVTFSAHQIILATRSDVLKAMLQTNETESGPTVLQIEGMQPSICKIFLDYLYTATLPDLFAELAKALYEASMKYGVVSLKKQCSDFLLENYPDDAVQ